MIPLASDGGAAKQKLEISNLLPLYRNFAPLYHPGVAQLNSATSASTRSVAAVVVPVPSSAGMWTAFDGSWK